MAIDGMYKPTEEELELLKRWYAPDVTKKIDERRTNALGMNRAQIAQTGVKREVAVEDVNESPAQLSAQELDAISAQAREQGFEEGLVKGKEQGLANGYEEGFSQGIEQGIEQGTKQGLETAQAQIDQKIALLDSLLAQLQQPIEQQQELVEQSLLNLTLTLAQKVVHTEIKQNPEPITSAISQGLNLLGNDSAITIKLNPQDVDSATDIWDEAAQQTRHLTFVSDPSLAQGDCVLESNASSVCFELSQRCHQVFDDFITQEPPSVEGVDNTGQLNVEQALDEQDDEPNLPPQEES